MIKSDNNKYIITGGNGFLGQHVVKKLIQLNVDRNNIFVPRSKQYDLRSLNVVRKLLKKDYIVIHLAAKLGGISVNINKQGDFFYDNAIMSLNLIKVGNDVGIKKFVGIGSIWEYPDITEAPFKEEKLWDGYPAEVTAAYGMAKKVMLLASQNFYDQYKFNAIHLLLTNLYGPGDSFDPTNSHVIPAIILKVDYAKKNNLDYINVWGDGSASRELLYVKDAADAIIMATQKYNKKFPINIGTGKQTTIKELVTVISSLMGFKGFVKWQTDKLVGQKINQFNVDKAKTEFNFTSKTDLLYGLKATIKNFYISNKDFID